MKRIITSFLLMLSALVAVSFLWGLEANAQIKHTVQVTSNIFTPDELTINVGDTVEWKNIQGWHNVNGQKSTYPNNPVSFGNSAGSGWTYSFVFNTEGNYDYQCDPHVGFGMVGKVEVKAVSDDGKHQLTLNFTNMGPHIGQSMHLWVIDQESGNEFYATSLAVTNEFSVVVENLEEGKSYDIDFYADHNNNGSYDAPPTDHAWRLELNTVSKDTTLGFAHNVNFTDIFSTTGISDIQADEIVMYPNPANDRVTLEFKTPPGNLSIRMINISGQILDVLTFQSRNRIEIDLSELPRGVYLLTLNESDKREVRKLIKQ